MDEEKEDEEVDEEKEEEEEECSNNSSTKWPWVPRFNHQKEFMLATTDRLPIVTAFKEGGGVGGDLLY